MRYPRKTSGAAIMKTITSARSTPMIGRPSVSRRRVRARSGAGMLAFLVQRDHPRGQFGEADLALRELAHDRSAIEDDQAIGHLVDVREVVLDVDAGAATRLHPFDEGQHLADLAHRQRGGGLVEDDEVGLEVHGAGDGDALALSSREIAHGRVRGDAVTAEADGAPQELVGDLLLLLHVDEAEPPGDLPADEEVSPEGLLLAEALTLVHRLDAQIVRLAHRVPVGVLQAVAHPDFSRGRTQDAAHDLDQGGLAGAVVSQQTDDLVAADGEVDVRESLDLAEGHLHLFQADYVPEAHGCGFVGRGLGHSRRSGWSAVQTTLGSPECPPVVGRGRLQASAQVVAPVGGAAHPDAVGDILDRQSSRLQQLSTRVSLSRTAPEPSARPPGLDSKWPAGVAEVYKQAMELDVAPWWQTGVVYQIYPRSFQDSNGDGVGDLPGIAARLDHLASLGVDAIWISPFYPSPMKDFGYDVSDYTDVDPLFGRLADFDRLLAAAHERGLAVIIDWVPNHTSDQHSWFLGSRSSRDSPQRDWYVWRDPKPDGSLPNNSLSAFGGPAWTWDERTRQYYLHTFLKEQPDLNWRNPAVRRAMLDTLEFWLERGVDGFRIDVAHAVMKDPELRDNPPAPAGRRDFHKDMGAYGTQLHIYDRGHADTHIVYRDVRRLLERYSGTHARVSIGEIHLFDLAELVAYYGAEL